jgi:hypothetical protein
MSDQVSDQVREQIGDQVNGTDIQRNDRTIKAESEQAKEQVGGTDKGIARDTAKTFRRWSKRLVTKN